MENIQQNKAEKTWSHWTDLEDEKLKNLCANKDKSIAQVALEFSNKTFYSVKKRMQVLNLKVTNFKDWTEEEDSIIKEKYLTSENIRDFESLLPGRNYNAIKGRANLLGLKRYIKATMDENFFDSPNEINCSIAGFLAADGCIADEKYYRRIIIHISQKDLEYLENIKKLTKFTGNIYLNNYKQNIDFIKNGKHYFSEAESKFCKIIFYCEKWANDLKKYWNLGPRKTHILLPPNLHDLRLKIAYISGLIDGDGWITKSINTKDGNDIDFIIGIMGTKELMKWIMETYKFTVPNSEIKTIKETDSQNIGALNYINADVYWLGKIFLSLNIPRLERKWSKIREWIDRVETENISQRMKTEINKRIPSQEILDLFNISAPNFKIESKI